MELAVVINFVLGLAALIVVSCILVVSLTQIVAWYEYANSRPELMATRFRLSTLWGVLKPMVREVVVLSLLVPLWPFGFFKKAERRHASDEVPILLLHGLFQNQACWWWFRRQLEGAGHSVHSLNLSPWHNVEALTEILEKKIDRLRHRDGISQVVLVGHSMGGIIARNYIQLRGGAEKVRCCIQLGAPNQGSKLAPFALTPLGVLLMPSSDFLKRLNEAPLPETCSVTSIFSRNDAMVMPYSYSYLPGARNVELDGLGHTSLLFSRRALSAVQQELAGEKECDPSTLPQANVTK